MMMNEENENAERERETEEKINNRNFWSNLK